MAGAIAYEYSDDYSRYEMIDGRAVMMAPRPAVRHGWVATNIFLIFRRYLKKKRCVPFIDGYDVHLDKNTTLVPDAMIVCDRDKIKEDGIYGAPDLVVEVLSPSSTVRDKTVKKAIYERAGVKEYWIVDPLSKSIEVWLLVDGRYELDWVYAVIPDYEWRTMTEEERAEARLSVKVSLYDDFYADLAEIFEPI